MNRDSCELSKYRLEKAKEDLSTAIENLKNTHLSGSINRSYYCIFHTIRAILALDGFDSKKHSGVIAYFRQSYIKTGIFDKHYSEIIGMAFELRNKNDYDDFVVIEISEANKQITNAKLFLEIVEAYLENRWQYIDEEQ
ncbi:MAG: HEPN domain-containing protein [Eubacteriales bacterium]|nr:HEPN domain-containing protein [Eubacteriales bacterium]